MPIPKPQPSESKEEFIGRCMSDLHEEFKDNEQRYAVCVRQWEEKAEKSDNKTKNKSKIIKKIRPKTFKELSNDLAKDMEAAYTIAMEMALEQFNNADSIEQAIDAIEKMFMEEGNV